VRDGDHCVINGRKWYTTNATDPRRKICIFMDKTDPDDPDRHRQQSMILVPMETPGVEVLRRIPVFGFYDVPDRASELVFRNVRVPASNMLLGEGAASRSPRVVSVPAAPSPHAADWSRRTHAREDVPPRREPHGIRQAGVRADRDAGAHRRRAHYDRAGRLLTLNAAAATDTVGNKVAKAEIAMIKVALPNIACQIVDWAIQARGHDFGLAAAYATARHLRFADGPDEVHRNQIARFELRRRDASDPALAHEIGSLWCQADERDGHLTVPLARAWSSSGAATDRPNVASERAIDVTQGRSSRLELRAPVYATKPGRGLRFVWGINCGARSIPFRCEWRQQSPAGCPDRHQVEIQFEFVQLPR